MYNITIIIIEIIAAFLTIRVYKLSNKIVEHIPYYNDEANVKRISNKIRKLFQLTFALCMVVVLVISLTRLVQNEPINFLFILAFLFAAIITNLLNQGSVGSFNISYTSEETFLSKKSKKRLILSVYILFFIGFISIASFIGRSSLINNKVEEYDYSIAVQEEFNIDAETILFTHRDYLYLFSDFTSGLNIYDLDGNYIKSYYFYDSPNGASSLFIWNDSIFIYTRTNQLLKYTNGEYKGRVEVIHPSEEVDEYTVFNELDEIIVPKFTLNYRYDPVVFDSEYLYLESWDDGGIEYDGENFNNWSPSYENVTLGEYDFDDSYQIIGSQVLHNQNVIISTSYFYYVSMNFVLIWIIAFLVFMSILIVVKLNNLNDMTINTKSKDNLDDSNILVSDLEVFELYKKSLKYDSKMFFLTFILLLIVTIVVMIITWYEVVFFIYIALLVIFALYQLVSDLTFRNQSFGKRKYGIEIVTSEGLIPSLWLVIKRRLYTEGQDLKSYKYEDYVKNNESSNTRIRKKKSK